MHSGSVVLHVCGGLMAIVAVLPLLGAGASTTSFTPATLATTSAPQRARMLNGAWGIVPSRLTGWTSDNRIPMIHHTETATQENRIARIDDNVEEDTDLIEDEGEEEGRGKNKYYKKYKKYMLPLLLAYKLKFFTLIPILIGGLVLLTGATGLAGFFFALFAATMGLKGGGEH